MNKSEPSDVKVKDWVFLANEDLKIARVLLDEKIYHAVCFHSQQAAEKVIKAYHLKTLGRIRRIHNLVGLLDIDKKIKKEFLEIIEPIEFLDQFYAPVRYPDALPGSLPEGLPGKKEAEKALRCAQEIVDFVKKKIGA